MKRYTDYSIFELAHMTAGQLKNLIEIELMHEGVVVPSCPEEPTYIAYEAPKPCGIAYEVKTNSSWRLVAFKDNEQALTVAENCRGGFDLSTTYLSGKEYHYVSSVQVEPNISPRDIYHQSDLKAVKEAADENERRKKAYDEALKEWKTQSEAGTEITKQIMDTYYDAGRIINRLHSITSTYNKYLRLANDDSAVARAFLQTAYPIEDIIEAEEYQRWLILNPQETPQVES